MVLASVLRKDDGLKFVWGAYFSLLMLASLFFQISAGHQNPKPLAIDHPNLQEFPATSNWDPGYALVTLNPEPCNRGWVRTTARNQVLRQRYHNYDQKPQNPDSRRSGLGKPLVRTLERAGLGMACGNRVFGVFRTTRILKLTMRVRVGQACCESPRIGAWESCV